MSIPNRKQYLSTNTAAFGLLFIAAFETTVAERVRLDAEDAGIPLAKTVGDGLFGLRAARPEKAATRGSDLKEKQVL